MPPRPLPAREIVRRLERLGFRRVHQRGSHLKMQKKGEGTTRTVVVPMHRRDIAISVIGRILQQAGIEWEDLKSQK
ncbi:MAG TPA: type II toxin-antitoxin system HicA family toxin [Candidatus Hydrogenedentes bacterium]|nr:type II toxin-antitoxin system HicA family toxin [Candidatus Hydrogenedentota bacterium]HIJ74298.1 type II toxin-antitoxin system HicA family toxin [Candidatus Hydrogenedentota bacterium]